MASIKRKKGRVNRRGDLWVIWDDPQRTCKQQDQPCHEGMGC